MKRLRRQPSSALHSFLGHVSVAPELSWHLQEQQLMRKPPMDSTTTSRPLPSSAMEKSQRAASSPMSADCIDRR
jgi:hypothetical protein